MGQRTVGGTRVAEQVASSQLPGPVWCVLERGLKTQTGAAI